MTRVVLLLASITLAVLLVSGVALAYPSDLDSSFSRDGRVLTFFSPPSDPRMAWARDVALQADGKIVVVGYSQPDQYGKSGGFALARYSPDGTLDPSFGGDGRVLTPDPDATYRDYEYAKAGACSVAVQGDGKILVGGMRGDLLRYNHDGSLDASFGTEGKVSLGRRCTQDLTVQQDGKIMVRHSRNLVRLNQDGSMDTSFDGDGSLEPAGGNAYELQGDGKIVVGGSIRNAGGNLDLWLARYNPDGSPDTSFGDDGQVRTYLTSGDEGVWRVAVRPGDKILALGIGVILRYNADGSLDTSFGNNGKVAVADDYPYDVEFQDDGKIVFAYSGGTLVRYNSDGSPDTHFWESYDEAPHVEGRSFEIQSDGKIVVAGGTTYPRYGFSAQRFLGGTDESPPQTTITSKPPSITRSTTARFKFSSSEPRSSFQCSLDERAFRSCDYWNERTPEAEYDSLPNGVHTLRVQATDAVRNIDSTPAMYSWTVDARRPDGSALINGGRTYTASRSVALKLSASDPVPGSGVAYVRLKNDGGNWTGWKAYGSSRSWQLTKGAGKKTVYVQYKDRAGNVSAREYDTITYRP